jgi:hypothetical protein
MTGLAYLFERFPSFTQTFCYREIAELGRQGLAPAIFSIRHPTGEPAQDWDAAIVGQVQYLPGDEQLVREVDRALRKGKLPVWRRAQPAGSSDFSASDSVLPPTRTIFLRRNPSQFRWAT